MSSPERRRSLLAWFGCVAGAYTVLVIGYGLLTRFAMETLFDQSQDVWLVLLS